MNRGSNLGTIFRTQFSAPFSALGSALFTLGAEWTLLKLARELDGSNMNWIRQKRWFLKIGHPKTVGKSQWKPSCYHTCLFDTRSPFFEAHGTAVISFDCAPLFIFNSGPRSNSAKITGAEYHVLRSSVEIDGIMTYHADSPWNVTCINCDALHGLKHFNWRGR